MSARWNRALSGLLAGLALIVAGCGGSDTAPPSVGAAGGTVTGPAGAQVTVPAGALAGDTPITIAQSAAGAPALDPAFVAGGEVFELTPHGASFARPVAVRLPVDPSRVGPGLTPSLYKTDGQGGWVRVPGASVAGGFVSAEVSTFSWFRFGAWPPSITQQPASAQVEEPAAATFTVTALGSPPFAYRWQRSNDGGTSWDDVPGATQRSLSIAATSATPAAGGGDHGARYRVIVSNADGPTPSQAATLSVAGRPASPTITQQPAHVAVAIGADAAFSVQVAQNGVAYQWQRSGDAGVTWVTLPGQTNASLVLTAVTPSDTGSQVRVRVTLAGTSVFSDSATLTVVTTGPLRVHAAEIAAGRHWSLARRSNGTIFAWGEDGAGTLGNGGSGSGEIPMPLAAPPAIASVAASYYHGAAITAGGEAVGWGSNGFGEIGNGDHVNQIQPVRVIGASPSSRYQALSLGSNHTLLLRTDGRIEAAGYNGHGALGQPDTVYLADTAVELPGAARYSAIAAGGFFSVALRDDGTLWTFGANDAGQLGNGFNTPPAVRGALQQVLYVPHAPRAIAAGQRHAMALDSNGQVWAWGETVNGKLGIGPTVTAWVPPHRVLLGAGNFIAIAAGDQHSLALRDDGVVFAWGIDETGQLGQGRSLGMSHTPLAVPGLPRIRSIAAGGGLGHSLAVAEDGSLWSWGHNNFGQLGIASSTPFSRTPLQVPLLTLD